MQAFIRSVLAAAILLLGAGCASLPPAAAGDAASGFREVRNQPHYRVSVRDGTAAWPTPPLFRLPMVEVASDALDTAISPAQGGVVATHAARTVCLALAPWLQWTSADEGGRVALQVRRVAASSSGLAATSAVIDAVVPGPFRLPAGLGALRVDTRIEDGAGAALLELQWERGANPLLHRARASSIGDAWELAPSHARDLEEVLAPLKLAKQAEPVRKANIATCEQRFGRVSVAGRAASMFVPLSPEAIDPSDDTPRTAPQPQPQPQPQPNPGP